LPPSLLTKCIVANLPKSSHQPLFNQPISKPRRTLAIHKLAAAESTDGHALSNVS
jgi:hypothetical protein